MKERKKIVYCDLDCVLADFLGAIKNHPDYEISVKNDTIDELDVFGILEPMHGAIDGYKRLCKKYDVYIASTAPWKNTKAWTHKREWVETYLGNDAKKRLILTHHKNLLMGDYLIDDRTKNGAGEFVGEHIHFGTKGMETWKEVLKYLDC